MISCVLKGGLGNQMFQIAATINVAIKNKYNFMFNSSTWGARGGAALTFQASHPNSYLNTVYRKIPFNKSVMGFASVYNEPHFHYKEIECEDNTILNGYFQSEKYFKDSEKIIRKIFYPSKNITDAFFEKYGAHKNIVGIHVRRGEFLKDSQHHPPCEVEYYQSAMNKLKNIDGVKFLFVSDDINWCKKHFEGNLFSDNLNDVDDFYDLVMCDHNIIANSTFSWWSAWLNSNPEKIVIAPKKWFGPAYSGTILDDLIPKKWSVL